MSSTQLFPQVIDNTVLNQKPQGGIFLPIGIEGVMGAAGTATVGNTYTISRAADADIFLDAASDLCKIVKMLLDHGAGPVKVTPSVKAPTAATLAARQAAWQFQEADEQVRIRLTDSLLGADHIAFATSMDNAALLQNKQFGIVGMVKATTKAQLLTAATNAPSKKLVLVGPGVVDELGVIRDGNYTAAVIASMVALNADPSDDLDTATIPKIVSMEQTAAGYDIFRRLVVAGVATNDFEDLLVGGVSPVMPGINGGVGISHLRMTYKTDSTFDSLMTRIIIDQIFVLVKEYCVNFNQLRKGNTPTTRAQLASAVEALLKEHSDWIQPVLLPDGLTTGYGVTVTASTDQRQQIISYQGAVVRGVQTILVSGNLTIAA
jgi:hypothetical protein